MRAAPLLFLPLLVLAGCASASHGDEAAASAVARTEAKSASPMEGFASGVNGIAADAAETPAFFRSGKSAAAKAIGGEGAARAQAQTAAYETPVAVPRMVVRNGELNLRVKDVRIAEAQVRNVAASMGGSVDASSGSDLAGPAPSLSMTLRVPEARFDRTMSGLESLGDRLGKTVSSEDVTSQAVDMDARVKSLRVQEDAYRAILAAARRISDVLEVQEKLTEVRTQIEQIVAQRRALGDQAARSTVVVSLSQVAPAPAPVKAPETPGWFAATWGDATGALTAVVRGLATLALWLAVMAPVWIPLALLGVFAWRRTRTTQAV